MYDVLQFWMHVAFSSIGIFLSFILVLLIRNHTKLGMLKYRRVLYQNCVIESVFALVSGIVQFKIETIGNSTFLTFGGIHPTSQTGSNITASIYVYAFQTLLLSVVVQFFYRYLILVRKLNISNCLYTSILIPPLTASTLIGVGFYYVVDIMPPCSENVISQLETDKSHGHDHIPCVEFNMNHVAAKILILFAMIIVTTVSIVIVVLNILVYRFISQKAAFSSNEFSIQRQVSRTLIIQLCVIACCGFIPCICILMNAVLATDNLWLSMISECVFSLSPVVNPVFTIFTIKSYRRTVVYVFQRFLMLKRDVNSMTSTVHSVTKF